MMFFILFSTVRHETCLRSDKGLRERPHQNTLNLLTQCMYRNNNNRTCVAATLFQTFEMYYMLKLMLENYGFILSL